MSRSILINALLAMSVAFMGLSVSSCSDDDDVTPSHSSSSSSSTDDDDDDDSSTISATTIEANRFVYEIMTDYYYWYSEMPRLNYRTQTDTEEYFYNLLSSKDRFSYISDDADETTGQLQGEYTDFGWEYILTYMNSNQDTVAAIVTYVYGDTPASAAGAKRGDVIFSVSGTVMTGSNYSSVFSNATTGEFKGYRVVDGKVTTVTYSMTAAAITENPVAVSKVLTQDDGSKVGYLFYTSYSYTFNDDLKAAVQNFKDEGVTDVVLDLRYNTGGDLDALACMVDMLAPASAITNKSEYLYYDFNAKLQTLSSYSRENTALHFSDDPGVNLDLSRLVVLVGSSTYSASEATIWSLKPYMDVTLIGSTTGGKNSVMYVLSPSDFTYSSTGKPYFSTSIDNWLIMPIVAVYKNATGETFDTSGGYGLSPDYSVSDFYHVLSNGVKEIGDPEENLLSAALEYLSTGTVSTSKAATLEAQALGSSADAKLHALVDLRHQKISK